MRNLLLTCSLLLLAGCQSVAIVRGPNRNTDRIVIEVDWTTAKPPDKAMLDQAAAQIKASCDPSVTVSFVLGDDLHTSARSEWSSISIKAFAFFHQDTHGDDALYMLWMDGRLDGEQYTGGLAWGKRTFAIFPSASPDPVTLRTSIAHEAFHAFGLVDRYLKMRAPHAIGGHCDRPNCLMQPTSRAGYYALCSACLADLEAGELKE